MQFPRPNLAPRLALPLLLACTLQVVVEAIERRYDEGRSLLNAHQLCVFAALLWDMRSPFRTKWLGICLDHLASCRWGQDCVCVCGGVLQS